MKPGLRMQSFSKERFGLVLAKSTRLHLGLVVAWVLVILVAYEINLIDRQTTPATLPNIPNLGQNDWNLNHERIGSSAKILNSPAMVGELVAQGRAVVNNVQNRSYDWGVVSFDQYRNPMGYAPLDAVHQYYHKVDQVTIDMPQGRAIWTLEFWAPLSQ